MNVEHARIVESAVVSRREATTTERAASRRSDQVARCLVDSGRREN
jgi:hypothetical protein